MLASPKWLPIVLRINSDPFKCRPQDPWDLALLLLSHLHSPGEAPLTSSLLLKPAELSPPGASHWGSLCSERPSLPPPSPNPAVCVDASSSCLRRTGPYLSRGRRRPPCPSPFTSPQHLDQLKSPVVYLPSAASVPSRALSPLTCAHHPHQQVPL